MRVMTTPQHDLAATSTAVFLDIDGTLNTRVCEPGSTLMRRSSGATISVVDTGESYEYAIHAVRETVDWLNALHANGVQLIWSTTWNDQAEDYAEWFGLPAGLPFVRQDNANRVSFGHSMKVPPVLAYLDAHPEITKAVLLEDLIGWLDQDLDAVTAGRLLIPELDEELGVTANVRAQVDEFLGLT
ncbi:hypothetical protein ACT17_14845 [Mycolicibacterium conceptionense]|uniref:Uncharacterized protein n=2 Tax=Mycolicibacterium conceptionense TaxID=451644 RepID=A0A0J8U987_9MYCO|nr:hypothetical protein ACT17_14845 [Mycolicibacterium conceptionense]